MNRPCRAAPSLAAAFLTAFVLLSAGCSLPRIIVLHDPLIAADHNALGRVYEAQGMNDLALRQYREAFEQDPENSESLMLLGDLSYRAGDYAGAEQAYARALRVDPENGDARNNLAWVLIRSGRGMDRAQELIRQALAVNPAHRAFYLDTLGVILLKQGNPAEAVAVLEEAASALSAESPELKAELQEHLASARKATRERAVLRVGSSPSLPNE